MPSISKLKINGVEYDIAGSGGGGASWGSITGTLSNQTDLNNALSKKYDTSDTAENNLADGDYVPFYDTSATAKRKTLWSNIKAKLKDYFDGIYATISAVNNKVDKVSGKGLSTNDYTTADKNKVDSLKDLAYIAKDGTSSTKYLKGNGEWETFPTIGNGTLTIQKNGTTVKTFTANQSGNVEANITVPTKTSELTNDSYFPVDANYVHTDNNFTTAYKNAVDGKVNKSGDTMTGKLTANGRLASPTSGGTYISQKDPTKAALNITTDAVVNGSRYDNIIAGKSTDDSTWSIGIIDNTICFGRFSSSQTENNFTNVIRIPLATKTGTVATTTELTNGSVTKVGTGNVGSATNPMYLNAGVPTSCSYSLNKSVPSDAKFTDTTYNFAGNTFYSGDQNNAEHNANNAIKNGHYYYTSNGPSTSIGASGNDGALYVQQYSDSWVAQIAQDYRNGTLFVRGKNNGTWKSWVKILHERCDSPSFLNGITIYDDTPVSSVQTRVNTAGVETRGTVKVIGSGSEYNYSELRDDGVYINGTPLQPKIPVNPSSSEKQYLTFWIEVDYEPTPTPN